MYKNGIMRFRQLGNSGLTVSEVGLGCNNFGGRCDYEISKDVVYAALDSGITFLDTADVYGNQGGSETFLGEILKGVREEVIVATKFGMSMGDSERARGSRRYVYKALDASLRRLQTDYIDLYQFHEPDPWTPIEETLAALNDLVRAGKVRYIGSSNFSGWQLASAEFIAQSKSYERFVSAQNLYSILEREVERELIPAAQNFGVGLLPFYPLAAGLLTGKFKRNQPVLSNTRLSTRPQVVEDANFDLLEDLESIALKDGVMLVDLSIGWLLYNPVVSSVIAGATSVTQVRSNALANDYTMSDATYDKVSKVLAFHGQ